MSNGNITVSREALRAELAELELRLTEKLASRDSLVAVEARMAKHIGDVEHEIQTLAKHDIQELAQRVLSESQIKEIVRKEISSDKDTGRSYWNWVFGAVIVLLSVSTFVLNLASQGG